MSVGRRVPCLLLLCCWSSAWAQTTVSAFSPEGQVGRVRQAVARFSQPMVAFGDLRAESPFDVDRAVPGSGRWVDAQTWSYDFERDLRFMPAVEPERSEWFVRGMETALVEMVARARRTPRIVYPADQAATWAPVPGEHELKLVGADGRAVAAARFAVRGAVPPGQPASTFSTSSGGSAIRSSGSGVNSGESER